MSIPFCRTPTAAWSEISLYDGYSGHEERTGQPGIRAQGPEKIKGKFQGQGPEEVKGRTERSNVSVVIDFCYI